MKVKVEAKAFVGNEVTGFIQVGFLYKLNDEWKYHGLIPFKGHPVWDELEKRKIIADVIRIKKNG